MFCRDSQNGLSLAILAAFVVAIRSGTLPATDRSGKIRRSQPRGIDQVCAAGEDPHPSNLTILSLLGSRPAMPDPHAVRETVARLLRDLEEP